MREVCCTDAGLKNQRWLESECKTSFWPFSHGRSNAPASRRGFSGLSGQFLFQHPSLFFEYSGEFFPVHHAITVRRDEYAMPVKSAHPNMETWSYFGSRGLLRMWRSRKPNPGQSDSENHPTKDSNSRHSSATHQACRSVKNCRRQVERRCCDCAKSIMVP